MSTKERLLEVAIQEFASVGYEKATIADISTKAEANIAAVNYHFGSKENLYVEAWQTAFAESVARHPADHGVPATASAEKRFAGRIRAVVTRISDPLCREADIIAKEMANPTNILQEAIHKAVGPFRKAMINTIRELLGGAATPEQLHLCAMSVMSQCMHLMVLRNVPALPTPPDLPPLPPPAQLAEHIISFSLAALREKRREYEHQNAEGIQQ